MNAKTRAAAKREELWRKIDAEAEALAKRARAIQAELDETNELIFHTERGAGFIARALRESARRTRAKLAELARTPSFLELAA